MPVWTQVEQGIQDRLKAMTTRANSVSSYMNRTLFRKYQKAQIERWQTENQSQGEVWKPITQPYKKRKARKFASFPGAGNVLMVATGSLAKGAQAEDSTFYFKTVTDTSFIVGINQGALPYSKYPGVLRPFMQFSESTMREWREGVMAYVAKAVEQ